MTPSWLHVPDKKNTVLVTLMIIFSTAALVWVALLCYDGWEDYKVREVAKLTVAMNTVDGEVAVEKVRKEVELVYQIYTNDILYVEKKDFDKLKGRVKQLEKELESLVTVLENSSKRDEK